MAENIEAKEKGFRKLIVWQRAHQMVLLIYQLTDKFPKSEIYGLTSQLRRVAVSVPANIAEGYGYDYGREGQIGRHLDIAQGSLSEVEYYLILSQDIQYLNQDEYKQAEALRSEVVYLLYRLVQTIKNLS